MIPPPVVNPLDLLVLLEDGPKTVLQLATWLKSPSQAVLSALHAQRRMGTVQALTTGRWALASYLPLPVPAVGADEDLDEAPGPEPDEDLEPELDARAAETEADVAAVDAYLETVPAVRPAKRGLRQARTKPPTDVRPSWWTTAPPTGFSDTAKTHFERIRLRDVAGASKDDYADA